MRSLRSLNQCLGAFLLALMLAASFAVPVVILYFAVKIIRLAWYM